MGTNTDNPNYGRRTMQTERVTHVDENRPKEADYAAIAANHQFVKLDAFDAARQGRKHMLEVHKHLPYIRQCREKGRPPRRVSKKILDTVARLGLA